MAVGPMLLERLTELNGTELSSHSRARAGEMLEGPVSGVEQQLDTMYVAKPFPLAEDQTNAGRLSVRLATAVSKNYRLQAAKESAKQLFQKPVDPMAALRRAASRLRRAMLTHLLLYEPVPIALWREHHKLFLAARQRVTKGRRASRSDQEGYREIEAAYAQFILLTHASPYRFRHADLLQAHRLLAVWSDFCHLTTDTKWDGKALVLDVGADEPLSVDPHRASPHAVYVDIASLSGHMQRALDEAGEGATELEITTDEGDEKVSIELVQSLATSWGMPLSRGHKRLAATHEMDVYCGLPTVHRIAAGRDLEQLVSDVPASLRQAMSGGANWATLSTRTRAIQPGKARVVDQSVGGFRLRWSSGGGVKARVGELLALRPTSSKDSVAWNYGVVRWIRASDLGWVQGGVELISRGANGVLLMMRNAEGRDMPPQRALVFAPLRGADGSVRTLVAPPIKLGEATMLRISNPEAPTLGMLDVELIHLQEQTSEFCQWECRLIAAS